MKIKISYQTLFLPPPYAYGYTLDLEIQEQEVNIHYELEYLNRDSISLEEVIVEGYTPNDDFKWSGSLGKVWADLLKSELKKVRLVKESEHEHVWLHMEIKNTSEQSGLVDDPEKWDYLLQELIQGIYEKAGKELPLKITIRHVSSDQTNYEVTGSFVSRTAGINAIPISWSKLKSIMENIFAMEFDEPAKKSTDKRGLWADVDGSNQFYYINNKAIASNIRSLLEL